jgi:hypothetical protein
MHRSSRLRLPRTETAQLTRRRALARSQILRASAPLSPLPPAAYADLSAATAAALSSGEYLQLKPGAEAEPVNPLDPKNMDTMMDGMKKQAVMM